MINTFNHHKLLKVPTAGHRRPLVSGEQLRPLQDFQSLMTFMKDVEATKKMDVRKRRLFRILQSRGRPSWVQEVLAEMQLCNCCYEESITFFDPKS